MIARAPFSFVCIVVLSTVASGCSFHWSAGTSSTTSREVEERREKRRYRVSYRTQETHRPDSYKEADKEKEASFETRKRDRVTARKDKPTSGKGSSRDTTKPGAGQATDEQTVGGITSGGHASGEKPSTEQAGPGSNGAGAVTGTGAGEPVVLKPDSGAVGETEEEKERRRRRTAQERVEELVDQKNEELERKEAQRKKRMDKVLGEAVEQKQ